MPVNYSIQLQMQKNTEIQIQIHIFNIQKSNFLRTIQFFTNEAKRPNKFSIMQCVWTCLSTFIQSLFPKVTLTMFSLLE